MTLVERIGRRGRFDNLREIRTLDPYDDADRDRIVTLTGRHDFPWDLDQGTAIAFLRDYGVPVDRAAARPHEAVRERRHQAVRRHAVLPGGGGVRGRRLAALARRRRPAQQDPRPLRHPQPRVPVRAGDHAGRPGPLDRQVRLAADGPQRARRADPVHDPLRRADEHHRAARDLRRLPHAARRLRARALRARPRGDPRHRGHHQDRPGHLAVVPAARLPPRVRSR